MRKQLVNFITCGCDSSAPFFVSTYMYQKKYQYDLFLFVWKSMRMIWYFLGCLMALSAISWGPVLVVEEFLQLTNLGTHPHIGDSLVWVVRSRRQLPKVTSDMHLKILPMYLSVCLSLSENNKKFPVISTWKVKKKL